MTQSIPEQGAYLHAVLTGHVRYYGVPGNGAALQTFHHQLTWYWGRAPTRQPPCPGLGATQVPHPPLAPVSAYLPSLDSPAPRRHDPRQEPGVVAPHAGICGGGAQRGTFLLRLPIGFNSGSTHPVR